MPGSAKITAVRATPVPHPYHAEISDHFAVIKRGLANRIVRLGELIIPAIRQPKLAEIDRNGAMAGKCRCAVHVRADSAHVRETQCSCGFGGHSRYAPSDSIRPKNGSKRIQHASVEWPPPSDASTILSSDDAGNFKRRRVRLRKITTI